VADALIAAAAASPHLSNALAEHSTVGLVGAGAGRGMARHTWGLAALRLSDQLTKGETVDWLLVGRLTSKSSATLQARGVISVVCKGVSVV
jgi:hypothetical protein